MHIVSNQQIAQVFEEIGNLLDIDGANFFRVNAYKNAAESIRGYGEEISQLSSEDISSLPGIGKDLSLKIQELLTTGKCEYHQDLLKKYGHGLLDILEIRSIGPKKVKLFYQELGIDTLPKLERAASKGQLRKLPRMGEKSELEIIEAIQQHKKHSQRMRIDEAYNQATDIIDFMKPAPEILKIEYAGSLRRGKETIGDLDILIAPKRIENTGKIIAKFHTYPAIQNIIAHGETKTSVILQSGVQVDVRIVEKKSYGAALHYFTGSKEHNIAIRDIAKKKGLKVNEYGIFKGEQYLAGKNEEEMYSHFNLPYISPRLRENIGEFEAAAKNKLPELVELGDLKGDLHMHTNESDGHLELHDLVKLCIKKKYQYIAITDHSKALGVAHGLDLPRFKKQWAEIDALNKKYNGTIRILKGVECEILRDGSLDFPDSILEQFDWVVASLHIGRFYHQNQTALLLSALDNPHVKMLGHPSGREINVRPAYQADFSKIFTKAADKNVILEINSQPKRLDLSDIMIREAKQKKCIFAINTDTHRAEHLDHLKYGIWTAQRGWLEPKDIVNTQPLNQFRKLLKH